MESFAPFIEEVALGIVDDPHTNKAMVLKELVTVCPSCLSMHSLRKEGAVIHCVECFWSAPARQPAHAA